MRRPLSIFCPLRLVAAFFAAAGVSSLAFAGAARDPNFRWKMGYFLTDTSAGAVVSETPRNSILVIQPTLLWDVTTIRTKVGVHFIGEFISDFGLFPVSGIGLSAYFYPFGISSTYEYSPDSTLFQKSLTAPYVYGGITPVNFNLNRAGNSSSLQNVVFNSMIMEFSAGVGLDYPLRPNFIVNLELNIRTGTTTEDQAEGGSIDYFNPGIMVGFMLNYP